MRSRPSSSILLRLLVASLLLHVFVLGPSLLPEAEAESLRAKLRGRPLWLYWRSQNRRNRKSKVEKKIRNG